MQFENFSFGSLQIDGNTYDRDVVIDRGEICKRKKALSKQFRDDFGHTPTLDRGEYPLEVPSARHRHRGIRQTASGWMKCDARRNAAKSSLREWRSHAASQTLVRL